MVELLLAQQASLRQSLEEQEKHAVEQEAKRQQVWQNLITQQHETRTAVRKTTTSWIEELHATESSIQTAMDHIRQASGGIKTAKSAGSAPAEASKTPSPTHHQTTEEKKEEIVLGDLD